MGSRSPAIPTVRARSSRRTPWMQPTTTRTSSRRVRRASGPHARDRRTSYRYTVTGALAPMLPAESYPRADNWCAPLATLFVFHLIDAVQEAALQLAEP